MANPAAEAVLRGSDSENDLWELYVSLSVPKNDAQRNFSRAWEALELIGSDGFEKLFEQDTSLEAYADALDAVGMSQMRPVFNRVLGLVPVELRRGSREDELFSHLVGLFDELKQLAYDSYDASTDRGPIIARYVRGHAGDFE
jgi:hypothetical protein